MSSLPSPAPVSHGALPSPVPAARAAPPTPSRAWLSDEEWQALLWPLGAPGARPDGHLQPQPPSQEAQP
ncbi:MAG: hypothetical protein ACKOFG_09115 [Limnohabitans sp.]